MTSDPGFATSIRVAQLLFPVRLRGDGFFLPGRSPLRSVRTVVNGDIAMHDQDFMEIVMVVGGTAVHRTIYGNQPISKGDVFILRPGAWHAYQSVRDLELFEFRFSMELLQRELSWTRDDPGIELMFWAAPSSLDRRGLVHLKLNAESQQRVLAMLEELAELTDPGAIGARTQEIGRLLVLVATLGQQVTSSLQKIRKGKPEPHHAVTRGIHLMEEHIRRDWTLPELAKRLDVEKSYLIRLFRAHTGSPPMQFLAKLRAERAAVLLLRPRRDISKIGRQVGWGDPNYFARRFKAHFGTSASHFRTQFLTTEDFRAEK